MAGRAGPGTISTGRAVPCRAGPFGQVWKGRGMDKVCDMGWGGFVFCLGGSFVRLGMKQCYQNKLKCY